MNILKVLLILSLFALVIGCEATVMETTVEDGNKTVKVTVEGDSGIAPTSWCTPGANWHMEATGDQGDVEAEWKIVELVSGGKYDGLCHVIYTMQTAEGDTTMDYYFAEDGKTGYMEIVGPGGQKISQTWSA